MDLNCSAFLEDSKASRSTTEREDLINTDDSDDLAIELVNCETDVEDSIISFDIRCVAVDCCRFAAF